MMRKKSCIGAKVAGWVVVHSSGIFAGGAPEKTQCWWTGNLQEKLTCSWKDSPKNES